MNLRSRVALTCLLSLTSWGTFARAGISSAPSSKELSKSPTSTAAPEFGPSVVFDRTDGSMQLSDLRGKMVVVVFFQSWCPTCNGWSPELLRQMAKAFGEDPSVVLLAMKVDGGTPTEAKAYLKGHGADLSKWIVASDTGGTYYQRVNGTNALWGYALIDDQGALIERGRAGSFYDEAKGKRFVLADPAKKPKAISGVSSLTVDSDTPDELLPIVKTAQAGKIVAAIRALRSYDHGKLKDPAVKLKATLNDALSARAEKASNDIKSEQAEIRYRAYATLQALSALSDLPVGQVAKKSLTSIRADKSFMADMTKQAQAESAFWAMISKSIRLEVEQRKTQLPTALKHFAEAFPGTAYAERAMGEAETISSGELVQ
jgi:cytochrome oxidase Cu insertion factor (SCO1/SenC/PrrC family)